MIRFATAALGGAAMLCACAAPQGEEPRAGENRAASKKRARQAIPELAPVSDEQAALYRQAFPTAEQFLPRPIPSEMIRSIDQGNDRYIQVLGGAKTLGYLRDFHGPVSIDEGLAEKPLNVILVFDADRHLTTILAPTPLTKRDGATMTPADLARLVSLARQPPEALQGVRRVEQVVEETSGATKPEYRDSVVRGAALTTARVVFLVRDTIRILQAAPRVWDQRLMQQVLAEYERAPAARAHALAELLPTLDTEQAMVESYRAMTMAYIEAQLAGEEPDPTVEKRFVMPAIGSQHSGREVLAACYRLANAGVRREVAEGCAHTLMRSGLGLNAAALARLNGTLRYLAGETKEAVPDLRVASDHIPLAADPLLHYRLADALARENQNEEACFVAKAVFVAHPLLPGAEQLLGSCGPGVSQVVEKLRQRMRQDLLKTRISGRPQVPELPLENEELEGHDLALFAADKVTVVIFFATWCPHCRTDLPHISTFVSTLPDDLKDKVQVLAVRTAVERETEPYAEFVERLAPNYPIWTDPVMSLAFSKFAKSQNVQAALPTLAVIDQYGFVKYFLPPGDFRDTARELLWTVQDLLANPDPAP